MGCLKRYQAAVSGYDDIVSDANGNQENKEDAMDESQTQIDADSVLNDSLKIDFIYGETDWMTSAHACKLQRAGKIKCDVYVNADCGHQLILENYQGFGRLLSAIVTKGLIRHLQSADE